MATAFDVERLARNMDPKPFYHYLEVGYYCSGRE